MFIFLYVMRVTKTFPSTLIVVTNVSLLCLPQWNINLHVFERQDAQIGPYRIACHHQSIFWMNIKKPFARVEENLQNMTQIKSGRKHRPPRLSKNINPIRWIKLPGNLVDKLSRYQPYQRGCLLRLISTK